MKKYLIALVLFGFCFGFIQQQHIAVIAKKVEAGLGFLEDANCAGAWYMNADGSTGETDRCVGGSEDLTVSTSDTIPTSATVPSEYSGASRDFELSEADYMYVADGGTTDISGAEQGLTVCAWFSLESDITAALLGKWSSSSGYMIRYNSTNSVIEFFIQKLNDTGYGYAISVTDVSSGWHHFCGVHDPVGNEIIVYIDGYEDTGDYNPLSFSDGIHASSDQFRIGAYSSDAIPFDGLIDEVIIMSRVLEPSEVLDIFTNGMDGQKGGND